MTLGTYAVPTYLVLSHPNRPELYLLNYINWLVVSVLRGNKIQSFWLQRRSTHTHVVHASSISLSLAPHGHAELSEYLGL